MFAFQPQVRIIGTVHANIHWFTLFPENKRITVENFQQFFRVKFKFTEKWITEQQLIINVYVRYISRPVCKFSGQAENWWYSWVEWAIKEVFVVRRLWSPLREMLRCLSSKKEEVLGLQYIVTWTHLNWPASLPVHVAEWWTGIGGLQHIYTCPNTVHLH